MNRLPLILTLSPSNGEKGLPQVSPLPASGERVRVRGYCDDGGLARRLVRRSLSGGGSLGEGGFLLLEVVVAVFLLSVALFALIDSLGRCVAAARSVQGYSTSEILLANKSFEFRIERGEDVLDQDGQFPDYPGFSWARRLEPTESEGLWKQTITVYWRERGNLASDSVVEYKYLPQKQR